MANKFFEVKEKVANWISKLGKARLLIATESELGVSFEVRYEALSKDEALAVLNNCENQYLVMYNDELVLQYFRKEL